jgi:hypothetical protein
MTARAFFDFLAWLCKYEIGTNGKKVCRGGE